MLSKVFVVGLVAAAGISMQGTIIIFSESDLRRYDPKFIQHKLQLIRMNVNFRMRMHQRGQKGNRHPY